MKRLLMLVLSGIMVMAVSGFIFIGCTKEGPQGPAGASGTNGKDANETCKLCHAKDVVDKVATEFELAKHSWGTTAFAEAGNVGCTPCHVQKAFVYVCQNNVPSTFTFNTTTKVWVNDYSTVASDALGAIGCFACHTSLHTTYGTQDLALTTTAPVAMTMWGGAKTINLTQDSGFANLCVKCHQPRPMTCNNDPAGRLLNYDSLKNFPKVVFYDSATGATNKYVKPSYRMHIHYGAIGAIYAGMGGIEFSGTYSYANSKHTTVASCQQCHMAEPMTGIAGGHAFNVRNAKESALSSSTTWNFNGCNVANCHADAPLDANSAKFKDTRTAVKALLDALALKLNSYGGGHDILHADASSTNLWWGITTKNYDGYLDIYDPSTNAAGAFRNPYPSGSWTAAQKAANLALPKFPKLLFVQAGALINFQLCLREYSLGIHNTSYSKALLQNSIDALIANAN